MSAKPRVLVLRAAGTNCDYETVLSFQKFGAKVDLIHINRLIRKEKDLENYQIFVIPGGFTYGDDISAGKILANELRYKLKDEIKKFIDDKKLILGICNGFQVLVKAGILPGNDNFEQEVSLTINDSGKFEDRWVYLKKPETSNQKPEKYIWTKDLPEVIYLPVAHAEGKFVVSNARVMERLKKNNQIVLQYCNEDGNLAGYPYNPNGSIENIAGICDETGRIFGLMPHPERHIDFYQNPRWTRQKTKKNPDGAYIFKNGIEYVKRYLQ